MLLKPAIFGQAGQTETVPSAHAAESPYPRPAMPDTAIGNAVSDASPVIRARTSPHHLHGKLDRIGKRLSSTCLSRKASADRHGSSSGTVVRRRKSPSGEMRCNRSALRAASEPRYNVALANASCGETSIGRATDYQIEEGVAGGVGVNVTEVLLLELSRVTKCSPTMISEKPITAFSGGSYDQIMAQIGENSRLTRLRARLLACT